MANSVPTVDRRRPGWPRLALACGMNYWREGVKDALRAWPEHPFSEVVLGTSLTWAAGGECFDTPAQYHTAAAEVRAMGLEPTLSIGKIVTSLDTFTRTYFTGCTFDCDKRTITLPDTRHTREVSNFRLTLNPEDPTVTIQLPGAKTWTSRIRVVDARTAILETCPFRPEWPRPDAICVYAEDNWQYLGHGNGAYDWLRRDQWERAADQIRRMHTNMKLQRLHVDLEPDMVIANDSEPGPHVHGGERWPRRLLPQIQDAAHDLIMRCWQTPQVTVWPSYADGNVFAPMFKCGFHGKPNTVRSLDEHMYWLPWNEGLLVELPARKVKCERQGLVYVPGLFPEITRDKAADLLTRLGTMGVQDAIVYIDGGQPIPAGLFTPSWRAS